MIMWTMMPFSVAVTAIALIVGSGSPVRFLKTSARGGWGVRELRWRHRGHGDPHDQGVDQRSQTKREKQRPGQGARWILELLGNVDEVLKADEGKDSNECRSCNSDPGADV